MSPPPGAKDEEVEAALEEYLLRVVERGSLLNGTVVQGSNSGLLDYALQKLLLDAGFANSKENRKVLLRVREKLSAVLKKDHEAKKPKAKSDKRPKKEKRAKRQAESDLKDEEEANAADDQPDDAMRGSQHHQRGGHRPWMPPNGGGNYPQWPNPLLGQYGIRGPWFNQGPPGMGQHNRLLGPHPRPHVGFYNPSGPVPLFQRLQQPWPGSRPPPPFPVPGGPRPNRRGKANQVAPEAVEEMRLRRAKLQEEISRCKMDMEKKMEFKKKASDLMKKLAAGDSNGDGVGETTVASKMPAETETAGSSGDDDLPADRWDLRLNPEDLKKIGLNQANDGQGSEDSEDMRREEEGCLDNDLLDSYGSKVDSAMNAEHSQKRVANKRCWDKILLRSRPAPKRVKLRRQIEAGADAADSDQEEVSRRDPKEEEAYKKLMLNMKKTIMTKDQSYLNNLINCPLKIQRMQLGTLLKEHHQGILQELTRLRFKNRDRMESGTEVDHDALRKDMECLDSVPEVSVQHLPDDFWSQIQGFIRNTSASNRESPEQNSSVRENGKTTEEEGEFVVQSPLAGENDDDEEIVEVPVPPKPQPLLVDLEEDNAVDEGGTDSQSVGSPQEDGASKEEVNSEAEGSATEDAETGGGRDGEPRQGRESATPTLNGESLLWLQNIAGEEEQLHRELGHLHQQMGQLQQQMGQLQEQVGRSVEKLQYFRELRSQILSGNGHAQ